MSVTLGPRVPFREAVTLMRGVGPRAEVRVPVRVRVKWL